MARNAFPHIPPKRDLSPEEMARTARRFRRKALLAKGGWLLFCRCPCCGWLTPPS